MIFNESNHPATHLALMVLNRDVEQMKAVCSKNNCQLVFVNLPMSYYTGHHVSGSMLDNVISQYVYAHNQVDSMYRQVAQQNNLDYIELTQHFKNLEDKTGYFYVLDGHPNKKGYAEIARFIGDTLINHIKLKTK
jgi:hypothetical protein